MGVAHKYNFPCMTNSSCCPMLLFHRQLFISTFP
jgi:hypothetical protein